MNKWNPDPKLWVIIPRGNLLKSLFPFCNHGVVLLIKQKRREKCFFHFWHEKDWRIQLRSLITSYRDVLMQSRWQYYQVMSGLIDSIAYTRLHPVSQQMYWPCDPWKSINKELSIEFCSPRAEKLATLPQKIFLKMVHSGVTHNSIKILYLQEKCREEWKREMHACRT